MKRKGRTTKVANGSLSTGDIAGRNEILISTLALGRELGLIKETSKQE